MRLTLVDNNEGILRMVCNECSVFTQKKPIHSRFEDTKIVIIRENPLRQHIAQPRRNLAQLQLKALELFRHLIGGSATVNFEQVLIKTYKYIADFTQLRYEIGSISFS